MAETYPYFTPSAINDCASAANPSPAIVSNGRMSVQTNSVHFSVISFLTDNGTVADLKKLLIGVAVDVGIAELQVPVWRRRCDVPPLHLSYDKTFLHFLQAT